MLAQNVVLIEALTKYFANFKEFADSLTDSVSKILDNQSTTITRLDELLISIPAEIGAQTAALELPLAAISGTSSLILAGLGTFFTFAIPTLTTMLTNTGNISTNTTDLLGQTTDINEYLHQSISSVVSVLGSIDNKSSNLLEEVHINNGISTAISNNTSTLLASITDDLIPPTNSIRSNVELIRQGLLTGLFKIQSVDVPPNVSHPDTLLDEIIKF